MLTYGATLGASIVVWIAETFSEEHQKAIEWLNERTSDDLLLFAVQPKVFQIDDSAPAVEFNVVEKPNELVKSASFTKQNLDDLSENRRQQLEFWTMFKKRLLEQKVVASAQTPRPQYWFDVPLGRSYINLSNVLNTSDGKIGIRVYIHERMAAAALTHLAAQRKAIEDEIGHQLQWNPHPEKRDKIVALTKDIDLNNHAAWPEYVDWLVDMTSRFRKAFMPRIQGLQLFEPPGPIA